MRQLVPLIVCIAGCGVSSNGRGIYDLSLNGGGDLAGVDLSGTFGPCSDSSPCPLGEICLNMMCIHDNGSCTVDDDCENDTYCDCTQGGGGDMGACMGGECVPYGDAPRGLFDPDCHGQSFSATDFKPPVQKCQWTAKNGASDVIMTPVVADLDKDGKPEIIFVTYDGHTVAIHGNDCSEVWNKSTPMLRTFNHIAVADLDGDGFPEIVGIADPGVVVLDHNGNLLASGTASVSICSGPAIADVDGVAPPEILVDGTVLRYTKGNPNLAVLYSKTTVPAQWGNVSLWADMDGDGKPEAVTGNLVYDGITGADETPANLKALGTPGSYPAIADFNGDGKPDIVSVQSSPGEQKLSVFDYANNKVIFGPFTVAGGGWGGTPTVGDYDGDGVPDIGFASATSYYVYALKCTKMPKPVDCKGTDPGVLWSRTTHDSSSGGTGSSTFDFNGDGLQEVVYRDECWFRVYSGSDGKTIFAQVISSGTCLEYPVIADVDNDGHADVVVPSDNVQGESCAGTPEGQTGQMWTKSTSGIFVLTDPMNRWMPSRPLWTSHTYHITEINDDLSVPLHEKPNWKTFNNYRKNVQGAAGMASPQADLTGGQTTFIDNGGADCDVSERLYANVCNRGTAPVAPGVPGAFYQSDPRNGPATPLCTTKTTLTLQPGDCEAVHCDWPMPPNMPVDLWFRADDDGVKANVAGECKNNNDVLFMKQVVCMKIG